ncbi:N-acetylmuramoyl-L-alanine amidase [Kribbella orskensis]|uniref:N-acetylmuramoyl-L-alanine amidase n=1 Tax=Kribbella orskensis TaxID=2512216 RepID=A0ABY2BLN5_9ACTN|nr:MULTISPECIES: N-acetylmuramoyl-L-alanine amidase [Kribbella]TCN41048.1 N-acetylmuramoyl-L-alanine amidase [Kribbella sp. VKM Ac-2500]TCO24300.1 N-acetylmuramoyl-L-alanine amidase [Kribbella orskensis]
MPYLTDLAGVARKTNLEVIEVPGWETRGRGEMSDVRAVVCHHTATLNRTADMPSLDILINGRPDLAGPLSHFGLSRSGKVYVIAAGRCNHAGAVQNPSWGNSHSIGIEAEATGTDATWPEVQMAAFAQLCRVLIDHFGLSVSAVLGHKDVADPPGRKIDPNFDMPAFRARISALSGTPAPAPTPTPVPTPAPAPAPAPAPSSPWLSWPSWLPSMPWYEGESMNGAGAATPVVRPGTPRAGQDVLPVYLSGQALNVRRHLNALRDFRRDEFGSQPARPSEGHVQAVNSLLATLRGPLKTVVERLDRASDAAQTRPSESRVGLAMELKTQAHDLVRATERVWDFYFELFGQRQGAFGEWLDACDRITLDCYQHVFMHLGNERSIPSPPPFCYMRTGFSPATFRRGIPLRRLGRQVNPFPLVQLPYHRLVNPWTMGAILHEVSHNLQNELQLEQAVPSSIASRLREAGIPEPVASVWVRWNREIFGDMVGCLLGGEAFVASLMDVIGRTSAQSLGYSPRSVHPTPYLRTFLSCELLRRMGFPERAAEYRRAWSQLYPSPREGALPPKLLATADRTIPAVVEAVCYTRFNGLGGKALRDVIFFEPRHQSMIEEAGRRLAKGVDPGVVPERFLIGAVRSALDQGRAEPERLMRNFYVQLARR